MPSALENIKKRIAKELALPGAVFSYPPDPTFGDLSLACFQPAKAMEQDPVTYAKATSEKLAKTKSLKRYISEVRAVGPYLNFFMQPAYVAERVIQEARRGKAAYGSNRSGKNRKVMIEFSNGNTHKEYHVGHLRNIAYGSAVNRLLSANGYHSIPVSYINDFGIHVAKTLWYWKRSGRFEDRQEDKGYLLGQCYAEASRELESQPEHKEAVSDMMKAIESRSGEEYHLWEETRLWSIRYFQSIYKDLGIRFAHTFYENEFIAAGMALVQEWLNSGLLEKSQGAIIANLEKFNLGVLPVIRSDGTALYPVADLALAQEKFRRFHVEESLYVVDVRQSLYFQQLAKLFSLAGYKQKLQHLAYEFVTLPEGMMSSRTGKVITYEELKNKVFEKLVAETKKRHEDWTNDRARQVAWSLTVSTIKFEMLKVSADKIITFNLDEAARFDGYTACYIQYGYARLKSILRKEKISLFAGPISYAHLTEQKEKSLIMSLARYPEVVQQAGEKRNPAEIAKYLFDLVQEFNDYYHDVHILKAEKKTRRARLAMIKALAVVLANGFRLLGLEIVEEM